jgi:hypothetical protein
LQLFFTGPFISLHIVGKAATKNHQRAKHAFSFERLSSHGAQPLALPGKKQG